VRPAIHRLRFARSPDNAVLSGVSGGLGARIGVEPVVVRIGFVVLTFAGAVGVLAYLAAWSLSLDPGDRRAPPPRPRTPQHAIAFGCVALGVLLLLREAGLWFGDAIGVPLVIGAIGAGVIYVGTGAEGPRWTRFGLGGAEIVSGRPSAWRLIIGSALVLGGMAWFLTTNRSLEGIYGVLLAVSVTTAGIGVVFGPWVYRMTHQLAREKHDRIRSEERAELAAHLHDSVLQTLALIQRNAGDARKMAGLARRQERELRAWLYGQLDLGTDRLEAAFLAMAAQVEEAHETPIEVVVVGDCDLDDRARAVVHACREAATNAAVHSGADDVSVYVECVPTAIDAYVRDRGKGFDPNTPTERRGIADSIHGRIERNGGTVSITTSPGEGCEVYIRLPRAGETQP
jgi:phage shock protein PspC (stress-responsive transcriptional regulator)/anti-sigma regulatory factor (Ser/Thr protein kinase)